MPLDRPEDDATKAALFDADIERVIWLSPSRHALTPLSLRQSKVKATYANTIDDEDRLAARRERRQRRAHTRRNGNSGQSVGITHLLRSPEEMTPLFCVSQSGFAAFDRVKNAEESRQARRAAYLKNNPEAT